MNLLKSDPDIKGFTSSTTSISAAFRGWYWSVRLSGWVGDDIAVVFIDQPGELHQADSQSAKLAERIKGHIERIYEEEGARQEELWCTAEQLYLF